VREREREREREGGREGVPDPTNTDQLETYIPLTEVCMRKRM
jgi:hypothetical protein